MHTVLGALALLKEQSQFSRFDEQELIILAESLVVYDLSSGAELFAPDDAAERLYFVTDGMVKLYGLSPGGKEKVIEVVGPGRLIAESVFFASESVYHFGASSVDHARVCGIDGRLYVSLIKDNNEHCFQALEALSQRLHRRMGDVIGQHFKNAPHRLAQFLLSLIPARESERVLLELTMSRTAIAASLSIEPATLSRSLSELSERGLIKIKGRQVLIPSVQQLANFG